MDIATLAQAVKLGGAVKHLFVSPVDAQGTPHLATAERITPEANGLIAITAWFCSQTASNVQVNPAVSLVIWDSEGDTGFQLVGEVQQLVDVAMMDGFVPGDTVVYPQVERKMIVKVRRILTFSHVPPGDVDLA